MRFAELLAAILFVNGADARPAFFIRGEARLPAAADAASRTGHHLHEMVRRGTRPDRFDHGSRIGKTVRHGQVDRHAFEKRPLRRGTGNGQRQFLDTGKTGKLVDVQPFETAIPLPVTTS